MPYKINIIYQDLHHYKELILPLINSLFNTHTTNDIFTNFNVMTNKGNINIQIIPTQLPNYNDSIPNTSNFIHHDSEIIHIDSDIIIIPYFTNDIKSYQYILTHWNYLISFNIPIIKIGITDDTNHKNDIVSNVYVESHSFYKLSPNHNNNHLLQNIIWKLCGYNCIISPIIP